MSFDNAAKFLTSEPSPELKAWRHEVVCTLIKAGVTNPNELINTTTKIHEFVISPKP